jgi:DNA-binding ferritin-like protein
MKLGSNVNLFLGLQAQLKINHWQTKGYARHQAFGGFYDSMDDLIDRFVESAMGKYGRFTLNGDEKTIELSNLSELDVKGMVKTLRDALIQLGDSLDSTDTDLLNLRDEMLAELNKLSYLLTLE